MSHRQIPSRESKGVLAWLDVRDSDHYKFEETTQNALFVIQGNTETSVEMRLEGARTNPKDLALLHASASI